MGNALGVAVIGVVFYGALGTTRASIAHALDASLICLIALGAVLAVAIQLLPGRPKAA